MKQYTNSKGESLPKVICAVVEWERKRLTPKCKKTDIGKLFTWGDSNIFGDRHIENDLRWMEIDEGNFDHFYSIFPTCKNSRGQELPEEIQVEIVEERLRQWGKDQAKYIFGFEWIESQKGNGYWIAVNSYDYTPTEIPTKSDDTFTPGEIVEVSDSENHIWKKREYVAFYENVYYTFSRETKLPAGYRYCRKIQPLELTLPELLTIAQEVKGTKVILKS